jgi:hypothetical protein
MAAFAISPTLVASLVVSVLVKMWGTSQENQA